MDPKGAVGARLELDNFGGQIIASNRNRFLHEIQASVRKGSFSPASRALYLFPLPRDLYSWISISDIEDHRHLHVAKDRKVSLRLCTRIGKIVSLVAVLLDAVENYLEWGRMGFNSAARLLKHESYSPTVFDER